MVNMHTHDVVGPCFYLFLPLYTLIRGRVLNENLENMPAAKGRLEPR